MSDPIERQNAIDTVHRAIFDFFDICSDDDESPITYKDKQLLEINKAITTQIRKLPSAQRWILVSEKFPEWHWTEYNGERCWESEPVLVYFGKTKWPYHSMAVGEYGDGRWEIEDDCFPDWGDPIAWMPLPKEPEINENNQTEATE